MDLDPGPGLQAWRPGGMINQPNRPTSQLLKLEWRERLRDASRID